MFKKKDDGTYAFSARFWTYTAVATALIVWIGYNTQAARNETEQLSAQTLTYAKETRECFAQLIHTSVARAALNSKRDDLSEHQRLEFLNMFQALLDPPTDISGLEQSDPVRQKWAEDTALVYVRSIAADQKQVEQIKAELIAHPIPDPNCGNDLPGQ